MEFWGIEVKPGQTIKCDPGEDKYLHLSQSSLGEVKKDKGVNIPVYVHVDGKKLVIGTLSPEKCAHITYDLVFEKEFELSHGWKDGNVFFVGYKTVISDEGPDGFSDTDSEDSMEEEPQAIEKVNGKALVKDSAKAIPKACIVKPSASASKAKPAEEPSKLKADGSSDEDDSDEDDSEDDDDSDQEMMGDSDGEDDESSDEEEKETPKKPESGKKRPLDSDSKTPASDKKAKLTTPAKTDGKKGGHVATPHPSKQAAKTPADDKSKQQTPKSGGSFSCKTCSKAFNSDNALQSHTKAKHAGK